MEGTKRGKARRRPDPAADDRRATILILMGVSGSGKTTIGTLLADALAWPYLEGDLLHPAGNIEAMTRGVALTDADRAPWLAAVRARLAEAAARGQNLVVACSALKASYRRFLSDGLPVRWVWLKGSAELIRQRLKSRTGHFAEADLLDSQIETLEEPAHALVVDVSRPPRAIVDQILEWLAGEPDVRVAVDPDELGARAAEAAAATIVQVVERAGRCSLVLSGGSTPRGFHRVLATRFRDEIPWTDVHVFWSDERYVPAGDPRSNYGMAKETLLDHVPCPPSNIHPMPTSFADPMAAAHAYEDTLRAYFGDASPSFDLAILGIGEDGHTASLFPDAPALLEQSRWVLAVTADADPPTRLTLTIPVLTSAVRSWFLVEGSSKAPAVRDVLVGSAHTRTSPAAAVHRAPGTVTWWLDRDAAALLDPRVTVNDATH